MKIIYTDTQYQLSKKLLLKLADILSNDEHKGYLHIDDDMIDITGKSKFLNIEIYPKYTETLYDEQDIKDMKKWFQTVKKIEKQFLKEIS